MLGALDDSIYCERLIMPSDAEVLKTSPGKFVSATYACLAATGILSLVFVVLELMHSAGLMTDSYQGWITLIGMWLGLPGMILAVLSVVLSIVAIFNGPKDLRLRIVSWWLIVGGGALLYRLFADTVITEQPGGSSPRVFGISEAVLLATVVLMSILPCAWLKQK
jgi:hypothetical protein